MARNALIKLRRGTAAQWTAVNPTLADGEPGYETDTEKLKIGDGTTDWANLDYVNLNYVMSEIDGGTSSS